jgi:hypothetical protein
VGYGPLCESVGKYGQAPRNNARSGGRPEVLTAIPSQGPQQRGLVQRIRGSATDAPLGIAGGAFFFVGPYNTVPPIASWAT